MKWYSPRSWSLLFISGSFEKITVSLTYKIISHCIMFSDSSSISSEQETRHYYSSHPTDLIAILERQRQQLERQAYRHRTFNSSKDDKSASKKVKFVKVANLKAEEKSRISEYYKKFWPAKYVNEVVSDK